MVKLGSVMAGLKCDFVWKDGRLVKWEDAKVHVSAWSLHYSVSIFEGIRAHPARLGGKQNTFVFRLGDHIRRLERGARLYEIPLKFSASEIEKAVVETVRKNGLKNCYIRPILYFGHWKSLMPNQRQPNSELAIFALPVKAGAEKAGEAEPVGLKCMISKWRKPSHDSLPGDVKCSANYALSYLAGLEAEKAGYDYAFLLDHRGLVSEGLASNVFIVKRGRLVTPPFSPSMLGGITRDSVLAVARDEGIACEERDLTADELRNADEVFVTGTLSDMVPVANIGGAKIGDGTEGQVTRELHEAYRRAVSGGNRKYWKWFTPVY
ncbi:Amino-transferase class IV [Candidatus Burarchaeum australiense]|nr:Amino-transferase class IV [Candidatus Burarchaeum australiense]